MYNETSYPHDSALTKRFVVKSTVERCDEFFFVVIPQIFDRVRQIKKEPYRATVPQLWKKMSTMILLHIQDQKYPQNANIFFPVEKLH